MLGDASRQFSTYLRIRIDGQSPGRAALASLLKDAQRKIGTPQRDQALWTSSDESAKIFRTRYLLPG
jgi:hypothetical protein